MQIQSISQNQNRQQNFGIQPIHQGNAAEVKAALSWIVDSFTTTEQEALLAKMRQSGEKVSIEFNRGGGDRIPALYMRDPEGKPIVLTISPEDSRQNFPTIMSFFNRPLFKSQKTTTPKKGISVADQLKQEFGIDA